MCSVFIADLGILQLYSGPHPPVGCPLPGPPKNINQNIGCCAQNMAMWLLFSKDCHFYLVVMNLPSSI